MADELNLEKTMELMAAAGIPESDCRMAYAGHGLTLKLEHLRDFAQAVRRAAPIAAQLDQQEQPKSDFLNHLAESGKAVEGWPAWKTGLWNSDRVAQLDQDAERKFEAWWEKEGQFIRAGGGQYEKSFAYKAWMDSRTEPAAAQLDAELPPPEALGLNFGAADFIYGYSRTTVEQIVAPYAERIRLLTEELENWKKSSGLLAASRDRWKDAAKQPAQGIDTPEFRALAESWAETAIYPDPTHEPYAALIAHIDGRTAGTAPAGWKPVHQTYYGVEGWRDIEEHAVDEHKAMGFEVRTVYVAAAPSPQEQS